MAGRSQPSSIQSLRDTLTGILEQQFTDTGARLRETCETFAGSLESETMNARQLSMLGPEALALLGAMAAASTGAILEVGAYTGGSTITILRALRGPRTVLSVEHGGALTDHPTMPTDDILRDLYANLEAAGVSSRVTVLPVSAHDAYPQLAGRLNGEKIGLLAIDADAHMGFHLPAVAEHLAPGCLLSLDDYYEPTKGQRMRAYLRDCVARGALEQFGVFGFGTWAGRLRDASALPLMPFMHDIGNAWQARIDMFPDGDTVNSPATSKLGLLEDGRPLGPSHATHDAIRYIGRGRFSHWGRMLYMSASDNTDPSLNGRKYQVVLGDIVHDLT